MEATEMWAPRKHLTAIDEFRKLVNDKFNMNFKNYWDLYNWSVKFYPEFWEEFFNYSKIIHSKPYETVIDKTEAMDDIPEWFAGAQLNYAENLLRYKDEKIALYIAGEYTNERKSVTYSELFRKTELYAAAMKEAGVRKGDCVVGYLPNAEEAVEAFLAASSLGAMWSSTSPDFGVTAILDRFRQIQPKILFSVDAVIYNGKKHKHLDKVQQVALGLPLLEKVVIVPLSSDELPCISVIPKSIFLHEFLESGREGDGSVVPLQFEQVPFNYPLCILYSSGTTGVPKCMVHSVGGTLIQHLKEHLLHGNMSKDDVIMYYTTTGWMMWNWLVSALAVGATLVLYNGSPFLPHNASMWDLVDELGITIFGTSAKWLAVSEQLGVRPGKTHQLKSLHTILSTGSPLIPSSYDYVYRDIKRDVLLGSITGGSDIISCFAGQNPTLPVHRGEIQSQNLGMAIECWDESGKAVSGQKGEMVCTKPFPSMPTAFWNDSDRKKYKQTYFSKFRGVWNHSDFLVINPVTRGIVMLGRSDGTLNPNGVRFGSAEIYNVVESFKEIQDSICVSQVCNEGDERVVLFLKLAVDHALTKELIDRVKLAIRQELSARHVPSVILPTKEIPYTLNGKKVEIAVKKIISGEKVSYREALSNPESLDLYADIPELQRF